MTLHDQSVRTALFDGFRYLRTLMLDQAVKLNHAPTVAKALALYRGWMTNGTSYVTWLAARMRQM